MNYLSFKLSLLHLHLFDIYHYLHLHFPQNHYHYQLLYLYKHTILLYSLIYIKLTKDVIYLYNYFDQKISSFNQLGNILSLLKIPCLHNNDGNDIHL